jgi:hypothetical protein
MCSFPLLSFELDTIEGRTRTTMATMTMTALTGARGRNGMSTCKFALPPFSEAEEAEIEAKARLMVKAATKSCGHRHRPLTDDELRTASYILGQPPDGLLRRSFFSWHCKWLQAGGTGNPPAGLVE